MIARYEAAGMMSNPSFAITASVGRRSARAAQREQVQPLHARAARAVRAVQPLIVVDAPYHKASGSGSPSNA